MITRCDHCGSRFQVSAELVNSQDPQVRCGECMTLFDARLNLYNEAESRKAATQYKPVRRKNASEVVAEHAAAGHHELETADTIASEHFYTRESSADRSHGGPISDHAPDINLDSTSGGKKSGEYRPHHVHRDSVADVEFERTRAHEFIDDSLIDRSVDHGVDDPDRAARYRPNPYSGSSGSATELPADDRPVEKKQQLAERERRALAIEPDRSLSEQQMHQLQEARARSDDKLKPAPVGLDLDLQSDAEKKQVIRDDYAFIPDDVLQKPSVFRDNGRRENLQFDNNTPRFDTSIANDTADASVPVETEKTARVQQQPKADVQPESKPQDSKPATQGNSSRSDERYKSHESSAQEMRRYQQHRPSVDVRQYIEPPETRKRTGVGFKPLLWLAGLIAAVCIVVFLARDLIANMNLPEPFVSSFCSVTGCVPAEAKKDVSQLEATRTQMFPHADLENVLVISVDVVNNSVYKQPYPTLDIELLDDQGTTVGERSFGSVDYEVVDRGQSEFLIPGELTRIKIELIDSGLEAADMNLVFQ